jgi:hypothetical protein
MNKTNEYRALKQQHTHTPTSHRGIVRRTIETNKHLSNILAHTDIHAPLDIHTRKEAVKMASDIYEHASTYIKSREQKIGEKAALEEWQQEEQYLHDIDKKMGI